MGEKRFRLSHVPNQSVLSCIFKNQTKLMERFQSYEHIRAAVARALRDLLWIG